MFLYLIFYLFLYHYEKEYEKVVKSNYKSLRSIEKEIAKKEQQLKKAKEFVK